MAEEPLNDECWVVRGGLMDILRLHDSVETGLAYEGVYNLSFWGENGLSVEEICELASIPNGRIRVSTIRRLREAGYELYRSDPFPHLTLEFEVRPTDNDLERLVGLFGEDIPNPSPKD